VGKKEGFPGIRVSKKTKIHRIIRSQRVTTGVDECVDSGGTNLDGPETRASLIEKLVDSANTWAWLEFAKIYQPLVYRVARHRGLQHSDAEDLSQEVMTRVNQAIGQFDPNRTGSFRGWLFTITRNLVVNHLKRNKSRQLLGTDSLEEILRQTPDENDETATVFSFEHQRQLFHIAAEIIRTRISTDTWSAFWLTAVEQEPIQEVAKKLTMTPGAIRMAKCRVLAQIRSEVAKLSVDEERTK
jgi:RNA polymerase sigma factor (sigma-70 family)